MWASFAKYWHRDAFIYCIEFIEVTKSAWSQLVTMDGHIVSHSYSLNCKITAKFITEITYSILYAF